MLNGLNAETQEIFTSYCNMVLWSCTFSKQALAHTN